jgi:hypothetical protein
MKVFEGQFHQVIKMDYDAFQHAHPTCGALCGMIGEGAERHHCWVGCGWADGIVNQLKDVITKMEAGTGQKLDEYCAPGQVDWEAEGFKLMHTHSGHTIPCLCTRFESQLRFREVRDRNSYRAI